MSLSLSRRERSYLTNSPTRMVPGRPNQLFGVATARLCRLLGTPAVFALGATSLVSADPITFTYRIDVISPCGLAVCFTQSFPLTLTFEENAIASVDELNNVRREYGPPTFSDVPLNRPAIPPGVPETGQVVDRLERFGPGVAWGRAATASSRHELITPSASSVWFTSLSSSQLFDTDEPDPILTPISLGAFLGTGILGRSFFSFGLLRTNESGISEFVVEYQGLATLQSQSEGPAATPEPAAWVLLTTGLGLCAVWGRKHLA
jgi:hypothetical protein